MKRTATLGGILPLVLFAFLLISGFSVAQPIRCYTDEMDSMRRAADPNLESSDDFETWIQDQIQLASGSKIIGGVYQIPVVVHVIHNGEAVGTGTNVSFAAIQSQIDVLNEDFRKLFGSNGWNTNPVGADTEIEFCLAMRRPDGSAFAAGEPGVNRINRSTAGFTAPPYTTTYIDATIKPWTYNNNVPTATRGWDPAKYMNIWLCDISGGILGYAQFPQSPLGGMGCGTPAASTDGVVFLYNSIGKSSVTGFAGPYNEGRTATHEIGHWLGLRHIWGDGGCNVDDFCNDTPVAGAANFGCPVGTNSCTAAPDAGVDQIENYMDYTDDMCMNIFTNDQKMRMRTVLENSPLRVSLINSDACVPPNANDASVVDITSPKGDNCAGAITPTVVLRNRGSSNLTSATISYKIDNGTATTFNWTGTLTPGSSANVNLPAFTTTLGTHNFKAYSTLPNGVADPSTIYDTSSIDFVVSNGEMAPFVENFDGGTFPPDIRWVIDNPNNDCYEWIGGSAMSITGVLDNNAAYFPGFGNGTSGTENMISPIFILPCNATAASLVFDVAYKRRNTTTNEQLFVDISTDCGATWNATPIYNKSGTTLATVTGTQNSSWFPTAATDWRTETINLLSFVGATSKNIKFRFRAVANNGNNVFIDNVRFNATTPGEVEVTQTGTDVLDGGYYNYGSVLAGSTNTAVFTITNPGTSNLTLTGPINVTGAGFTLASSFGTTTVAPGGTTTFSVTFSSATAGTFTGNVSFGTNDCDEGTYNFTLNGTALAIPPVADFSGTPTTVCAGSTVTFTDLSSYANSWLWNFGPGATPSTSTAQNPTVTFSTPGTNTITLTVTNSFGTDTETKTAYITVLDATGVALPISEGFTATTFVPAGWTLVNANNSPTTWVRTTLAGNTPTTGNSMMFDNFSYNDADDDQVRLPGANFQGLSSAQLQFDVAYAPYNATNYDGLEVLVSTDCGVTYTSVYSKSNTTLATAAATTAAFTPTAAQWRTETVNLTPYIGNSKVIVAFKNLSGYGNRLFVDNINLTGVVSTTPPTASFTATPTTVCTGQTVTFTNTSTGSPTSYSWSFPGGTPSTSTATNPTVTYAAAGVYNVSLTATNAGGSNTSTQTGYITVNAAPSAPGAITGTATVCSGSTGNVYSIAAVSGATSYTWTVPAGATITAGQGTTSATVTFGSTSGNVSVTATNSCGTSSASTYAVSVNSIPAAPGAITGSAAVCSGATGNIYSITAVSGATSYTWTAPSGATITAGQGTTSATITMGSTAGNVTVTATNACGTSAATTFAVTINSIPAAPGTISGTTAVCSGSTGNGYSIAAVSGATSYNWTVPTGSTVTAGQGTISATVTFGTTSGNIAVTATNSCGTSASTVLPITVSSVPAAPGTITGSAAVCSGTAGNVYSITAVSGATSYTWTAPSGSTITAGQGTTSATITFGSTSGSVTVTANNSCGSSAATTLPVTVNTAPATPGAISGSATVCSGSAGNVYSISSVSGATSYTWTVPTGASVTAGQGTTSVTVTFGATSGNISVTATNTCGTSSAAVLPVTTTAVAPATPGAISGAGTTCAGSTGLTYSITAVSGATSYTWTVPSGSTITAGQGTTTITLTTGTNSGTISVTASSSCGTSAASSLPLTVNAIPSAPSVAVTDNCGNSLLTATSAGTISWSTGESTSSITVNTAGTYTVTQTVNGCTSTPASVTAAPLIIPAAPSVTVTDNCGSSVLTANGSGSMVWSTTETTPSITVNSAGNYTVTQTVNGCTSVPASATAAPLTVPSAPTVTVNNLCGSTDLTAATAGTVLWSTGESTPTINVAAAGNYTVTQTVNGCTSAPASANAAPLTIPTVTVLPFGEVCINAPAFTLTGGSPAGGIYTGTGVTNNIFDPAVAGYGTFTITYSFTDVNDCSASAQETITVGCAGIEEVADHLISVYPNPSSDVVVISVNSGILNSIIVLDEAGRLIAENGDVSATELSIDVSKFSAGTYILKILAGDELFIERLVVKK